jgi:hypothetical protein
MPERRPSSEARKTKPADGRKAGNRKNDRNYRKESL